MVDKYGGSLKQSFGIPEGQIKEAIKNGVCKINIATDSRILFTAIIRKYFHDHKDQFDPRQYLGTARQELIEMIKEKNKEVLGSNNRANLIN
jgi:fructose-bisphosphate aldolase class II